MRFHCAAAGRAGRQAGGAYISGRLTPTIATGLTAVAASQCVATRWSRQRLTSARPVVPALLSETHDSSESRRTPAGAKHRGSTGGCCSCISSTSLRPAFCPPPSRWGRAPRSRRPAVRPRAHRGRVPTALPRRAPALRARAHRARSPARPPHRPPPRPHARAGSGGSGADQEAVRQHLSAAREALAELTKLPAASQLQGEQRQQVAQLISDFNSFATATTDWRPKYDTIDHELDQILGVNGTTGTSGSATGSAATTGASGSAGASTGTTADASTAGATGSAAGAVGTSGGGAAGGALNPTIIAKLREVRTHLDGFEEASGDPTFVVEKIEKNPRSGSRWRIGRRRGRHQRVDGRQHGVGRRLGHADRGASAGTAASARHDQGSGEAVVQR